RLLELPSRLHRGRARRPQRQPHRALRASPAPGRQKGEESLSTIVEEPLQAFLDDAEERGTIEESALEAYAAEKDLDDDALAALRAELGFREVDVAAPIREPERVPGHELPAST